MPPTRKRKINPYKAALIIGISAIVTAAVLITAFFIINNTRKYTSPKNAMAAAGIDTSGIGKTFTNGNLSAAVEVSPGKIPKIYFCSQTDGKWKYAKSQKVTLKSDVNEAYLFTSGNKKSAICIVFGEHKDAASMKLISSEKTEKDPLTFGEANGQKFYAFTFDNFDKDKNAYTAVEYKSDGSAAVSPDYKFEEGSFHITCKGTDYNYPVSSCADAAKSFSYRLSNLSANFSVFRSDVLSSDTFVLKYNSAVHTLIEPSKIKNGGVEYKSVTITMPLEGEDSGTVYIEGAHQGIICTKSADTLKEKVLKLISGSKAS